MSIFERPMTSLQTKPMKKAVFTLIHVLAKAFLVSSFNKDDTNNSGCTSSSVLGTCTGTGQYSTSGERPTYTFNLNFKAYNKVAITGDNTVRVDVATGT